MSNTEKKVNLGENQNLYEQEIKQPYFKTLSAFLDKYEDGWNILINASKDKNIDYPIKLKDKYKDDPYLPKDWMYFMDHVIGIIAHEKLHYSTYDNQIEIVRPDQMLDSNVRPLPNSPHHWTYGRDRISAQRNFDKRPHLAYETILNTSPAISYFLSTNSPVMQMLVCAHACYGHNTTYKNNYLFAGQTEAADIVAKNNRLRELCEEAEELYGYKEVEELLDFCNVMRFMDTSNDLNKEFKTAEQLKELQRQKRLKRRDTTPQKSILRNEYYRANDPTNAANSTEHPMRGEENILKFLGNSLQHLPSWKKEIMYLWSETSQNFLPLRRTTVLHEGIACKTEREVFDTLLNLGLIDASMYDEYRRDELNVLFQGPGWVYEKDPENPREDYVDPETGEKYKRFIGSKFNPYGLGFAIMQDVQRICENPDEEDKRWFPHIAGCDDWYEVKKDIIKSCSDETLVAQYLSPKVMRRFKMFLLEGEIIDRDDYNILTVTSIHAEEGFKKVREKLAENYRINDMIPKVTLKDYQEETDRCLILQHNVVKGQLLAPKAAREVLEYIHAQTKHPVVLESVNDDGKVIERYSSPPKYDYKPNQRNQVHFSMG